MKRRLLTCLALLAALGPLRGADALDRELARYAELVGKAQKTYEDAAARERARCIPVLAAAAKAEIRAGRVGEAGIAWKAVLRLDREHAEARSYFSSLHQLEAVLAEIDHPVDPMGDASGPDGRPKTLDVLLDVPASGSEQAAVGPVPAGSTLLIQYKSGTWRFRSDLPLSSPDQQDPADGRWRLVIDDATLGEGPAILALVPTGTAAKPFSWVADKDYERIYFRIHRQNQPAGTVQYRVRILPKSHDGVADRQPDARRRP